MSTRGRLLLALLSWLSLLAFVTLRLEVTTDISKFLPVGDDAVEAELSTTMAKSPLSRTLILSVEAKSPEAAVRASRLFEEKLRQSKPLMARLAFLEAGPPSEVDRTLYELYHPRRLGLAADSEAEARQLVSDEGLRLAAQRLRRQLASPLSTLIGRTAPEDPLLVLSERLRSLETQAGGALSVIDGRYVANERFAILLLGGKASAFDANEQEVVLAQVDQAFGQLKATIEDVKLESSGLARFSVHAKRSIQTDITRISVLSISCLIALCLLFFRSLRLVILSIVPVSFGMLAGIASLLLVYGEVHGLTLAFGASLIGVCVDYVIHLYVHHLDHPHPAGARALLQKLWPALALGATTTIVGFLVLAGSAFPGLRQAAIFGAVGVAAALASTRWVLPELLPNGAPGAHLRRRVSEALRKFLDRLASLGSGLWVLPAAAAVFAGWAGTQIRWDDDMANLTRFDRELEQEDQRVRDRIAQFEQSRFVVAVGEDEQAALAENDALQRKLHDAVNLGELEGFQGIGGLLPSAATQKSVAAVLRSSNLRQRLGAALSEEGFDSEAFEPFFRHLEQQKPEALTYDDFARSAAAPLVRSFRIDLENGVGFVTYLRGLQKPDALAKRLRDAPSSYFVDQGALMRSASEGYASRVTLLLALGLALILGVLWLRYRTFVVAAAALAPAILAAGTTMAVLTALGFALNILALTALLMVLSMGADYGVFLAEARYGKHETSTTGVTLMGMFIACLTTVFGFGVLAFSAHPALQTIGLTAAVGVCASFVFAPVALILARPDTREGTTGG